MPGEAKTRITLEGEKEYIRAMTEAAAVVKTLTSESRLAQAQFTATGDAESYTAAQTRILKEQIEAQKKAVEAAEKAVQDLTSQGVQPNDKAMLKWRQKLANARATLTGMETRLAGVEGEIKDTTQELSTGTTQAGEYQSALDKIGGTISVQAAIDSIDKITGAIENTAKWAARATKAIIGMATDAGAWADQIKTDAEGMGIDAETLQAMQYASTFIDTEFTDISRSWQDITKRMGEGNNDFAVALDGMGIAVRDAGGNLRSTEDIFWDCIDYLGTIDNETLRAAKATEIFGNDWRKLNPIINAGSAAYRELMDEGRELSVVSNENVDSLGSMDDQFHRTELSFNKLKMDALAALAPTFERVAQALQIAIQALDEFIQSEEGQEALTNLGNALTAIIEEFTGVDANGENNFSKLVGGAKDVVQSLNEALLWLQENADTVGRALRDIGIGYATLKVAGGVLTFMQLLKAIPMSKIATLFGGGGAADAGTATAAAAGATKGGLLKSLGAMALDVAPLVGTQAALVGGVWMASNAIHERNAERIHARTEEIRDTARDAAETIGGGADELLAAVEMAADALDITDRKAFDGSTVLSDPAKVTSTLRAFQGYEWLRDILDPRTWDELQRIGTDASTLDVGGEASLLQTITDAMINRMTREASGEPAPIRDPREALAGLTAYGKAPSQEQLWDLEDIQALAGFALEDMEPLGEDAVDGFAQGIRTATPGAVDEAVSMARQVMDAVAAIMDIHSPSRVMARMGLLSGEGFAQGIEDSTAQVERAVGHMLAVTRRAPAAAAAGGYGAGAGMAAAGAGASFSSSFYIDKYYQNSTEDARALAQRVRDANAWQRSGFGHR